MSSSGVTLLGLCSLFLCFLQTSGHAAHLLDTTVCQSLNVGHLPNDGSNVEDVSIKLVTNGEEKDCYNPDTTYDLVIKSTGKSIRGLLVLQDPDKTFGDFPYLPSKSRLNDGLIQGFCGDQSVSHNCIYSSEYEKQTKCALGDTITLPYRSPSDTSKTVEFRYSIVFKKEEFLEDKKVEFPACSTPLPEPAVCEPAEFQLSPAVSPVYDAQTGKKRLCRSPDGPPHNPRWSSNESRDITRNGQNYTCTVDGDKIRKKQCATGCDYNGKLLCCKIEDITYKQRQFTCIPHDPSDSIIHETFTVREERKCVCYECSAVCPIPTLAAPTTAAPTTEYAASGENTTQNTGNDNDTNSVEQAIETNSSL